MATAPEAAGFGAGRRKAGNGGGGSRKAEVKAARICKRRRYMNGTLSAAAAASAPADHYIGVVDRGAAYRRSIFVFSTL